MSGQKKWVSLADLQKASGVSPENNGQQTGSVYSTESGRLCPDCGQKADACECRARNREATKPTGKIRIRLEKKGRKGKGVTVIEAIPLAEPELQALAKALRQHCGVGGTAKPGIIELQGDQRDKATAYLKSQQLI